MHILIVDPKSILPARKYGGTQRVIWGLGKALIELGHKVSFLIAGGNSDEIGARILEYRSDQSLESQIPDDIDVVHLNTELREPISRPNITTIHGNITHENALDQNSVFLTQNHAKRHESDCFVYNGLYWDDYPKADLGLNRSYCHFLGKASWRIKNLKGACDIARKSGKELHVLGGDRWSFRNLKRNFRNAIDPGIKYHGMVGDEAKAKLISRSSGLIFPVLWDEPFGLALIESLYYGAPVFGTAHGSIPELITSEVGVSSNSKQELSDAIKEGAFDPKLCHEYARDNFDAKVMASSYLKLYEKVINGEKLNSNPPRFDPSLVKATYELSS